MSGARIRLPRARPRAVLRRRQGGHDGVSRHHRAGYDARRSGAHHVRAQDLLSPGGGAGNPRRRSHRGRLRPDCRRRPRRHSNLTVQIEVFRHPFLGRAARRGDGREVTPRLEVLQSAACSAGRLHGAFLIVRGVRRVARGDVQRSAYSPARGLAIVGERPPEHECRPRPASVLPSRGGVLCTCQSGCSSRVVAHSAATARRSGERPWWALLGP